MDPTPSDPPAFSDPTAEAPASGATAVEDTIDGGAATPTTDGAPTTDDEPTEAPASGATATDGAPTSADEPTATDSASTTADAPTADGASTTTEGAPTTDVPATTTDDPPTTDGASTTDDGDAPTTEGAPTTDVPATTTDVPPTTLADEDAPSATAPRTAADRTDRVFPAPAWVMALQTFGVAGVAVLLVSWLYRIWDAALQRPIANLDGDTNQIEMMVKNITETGWFLHGPRVGAPWGQQYYDVPHGGETLQIFFVKLITIFVKTTGLTMNIYFVFGFGLLAAVTFLVLRHLRFGPVISAACALGFTFLPYHFSHGQAHLWRSTYYSIPLAALLIIWSQSWRTRFLVQAAGKASSWRRNIRWWRVVGALVLCMIIGSTETISTFFTAVLLGCIGIVGAIRWREWQRLLVAFLPILAIGLTFVACSTPSLWFWHVHGKNDTAGRRTVLEGERYGLKLTSLLLSSDGSRVKALDTLGDRGKKGSPVGIEGGQSLGLLGAAGFLGLMYAAVAGPRQRRGPNGDPRAPDDRSALRETSAVATILAVLLGTIGGFGIIAALVGFSQIRTWGRISILIAFFVMLQIAMWGEQISVRARARNRLVARPLLGLLAVGLLAGTIALNPPIRVYDAKGLESRWESDRRFVRQIEAMMPEGSAIFQVPVMPFPEVNAPYAMHDYDPFRAYLADNGKLRWGYGAVKGRPDADWQDTLRKDVGPVAGLPGILGMGFTGLWIDLGGYGPSQKQQYEPKALIALLGPPMLIDSTNRFVFYDLRPYRKTLPYTDKELRDIAQGTFHVVPPPAPRPMD